LAVSYGQIEYVRTTLSIGSREIQTLHFIRPGPLDLVAVASAPDENDYPPVRWLGRRSAPSPPTSAASGARRRSGGCEVDVTNAALNSLLDLLEDRSWPVQGQAGSRTHPPLVSLSPLNALCLSR
jgi:hypothetical protein